MSLFRVEVISLFMSPPDFNRHRRDPSNWILGFIYFAPDDPRILVPKRLWALGLTLNFARPLAIPAVFAFIVAGALVRWAMLRFENLPRLVAVTVETVVALAVIAVCLRLARKRSAAPITKASSSMAI